MYIDIHRRFRDASDWNVLKNGEPTGGFSFTMLQHTGRFWSRISYQRTMWRHRSISLPSWTDSSWFLPFPSTEISIEGTALSWYNWHHWECDGKSKKNFTEWLAEMHPTSSYALSKVYSCIRGLTGIKM